MVPTVKQAASSRVQITGKSRQMVWSTATVSSSTRPNTSESMGVL